MSNIYLTIFGMILLFCSCGGSDSHLETPQEKDSSPLIANMSPLNNESYKRGDELVIYADVTDDNVLDWYMIEVNILDDTSIPKGTIPLSFIEKKSIADKKSVSIKHTISLVNNSSDDIVTRGDYKVKLTVVDAAGNKTIEERIISIQKRLDLIIEDLQPTDNEIIYIGDPIFLKTNIESEKLSYYEIDIHNNFDGHTHSGKTRVIVEDKPFSFNKKVEIKNTTDNTEITDVVDVTLFVGEDHNPVKEGLYHLVFSITDIDGDKKTETRSLRFVNK